ncbi:MAG: NAD(P)-dependent alcohol dehydrogenase [Nannocystaceae bacterium]
MRAAYTPTYGPPSVIELREVGAPMIGAKDVLIAVHASPVTAGDRRLRAADFPSFTALAGRLMMGVTGPRNPVQGTIFAGRVVDAGPEVTRYAVGDDVFGYAPHGAYAELLALPEDADFARMPAGLSYAEAAALPYGAGTANHFLGALAQVRPGEKVLLLGASGGVGRYAIQLAKHLGAEVTAVCGGHSVPLVRELGADHVVDYRGEDFTRSGLKYDVIFDIADATTFRRCRGSLRDGGRYLTLFVSVGVLLRMAWTRLVGGPRALFAVSMPSHEDIAALAALVDDGALRPVIAQSFPFGQIAEAHALAERRPPGDVIVDVAQAARLRAVA